MTNIVWLRHDLRLEDNPALFGAVQDKVPAVLTYIWNPNTNVEESLGSASRWWLHHSLIAFSAALAKQGAQLLICIGDPERELPRLASVHNAKAVFWNRAYDPSGGDQDRRVEAALRNAGVACRIFASANHLINPDDILSNKDKPLKVFTPFWKKASCKSVSKPLPAPAKFVVQQNPQTGATVDALNLLPKSDWASGLRDTWQPGELGARVQLEQFVEKGLINYGEARDYPAKIGTSKLSPHLHFGEITPRMIAAAINRVFEEKHAPKLAFMAEAFMRQLYWREFGMYLLHHFPYLVRRPMRGEFDRFPWCNAPEQLTLWQQGRTGYPIVDAGMRELWHTGWMHNRVRMIAASFLVKHLLLPWLWGAAWFWDTLVDADAANNTLGWQWVSGCGPDAAPYFRIFNPTTQGERYDAAGAYIRRWVPELAQVDNKHIHAPWTSQPGIRSYRGIIPDTAYPQPVIEHKEARQRALDTFAIIQNR